MGQKLIRVVHCKKELYDIYIGRGKNSKWGNPYSHKDDTLAEFKTNTRSEAIKKYKEWIVYGEGQYLLKDLHELRDKILGCWCKPKACHGDILKELVQDDDI